jgi:diaminopimelate decarboxylase
METPYLSIDKNNLEENLEYFQSLCEQYLEDYKIAFSVKTNSMTEVLKILNNGKCSFEVASMKELKLVKKFKTFKVFNSPAKTKEELKEAKKQEVLINVDSESEIEDLRVEGIKEAGIRIAFSDSKFGIALDKAGEIIEKCGRYGIKIAGLSSHLGTQETLKNYEIYLEMWKNFLERLDKKKKDEIKFIDLGGGFPDKLQLKNLSLSLEDYFVAIERILGKELKNKTLVLEPGRAIVSDAVSLIAKVVRIKENFGKKYAILDSGINFLPKMTLANYKFSKLNENKEKSKEEYLLAGPLLFSNDILGKYYESLKEGDLIKIENVGAYCYNLSWDISFDKPKIMVE